MLDPLRLVGLSKNKTRAITTQAIIIMAILMPLSPEEFGPGNSWKHSVSVQYDWDCLNRLISLLIACSCEQMHSQGSNPPSAMIIQRNQNSSEHLTLEAGAVSAVSAAAFSPAAGARQAETAAVQPQEPVLRNLSPSVLIRLTTSV